jgi:hypothetical protein
MRNDSTEGITEVGWAYALVPAVTHLTLAA